MIEHFNQRGTDDRTLKLKKGLLMEHLNQRGTDDMG